MPDRTPRFDAMPEWAHAAGRDGHAPVLDDIAWYGGNGGVEFELENGQGSSSWPDKQYSHKSAGTHAVGLRRPNPWGLHDMLGNVWEWCADEYGPYEMGAITDPPRGPARVVRGGSWSSVAESVRAASRYGSEPDLRDVNLGFRVVVGRGS